MAGYIFSLGADEYLNLFYSKSKSKKNKNLESSKEKAEQKAKQYALEQCILNGIYSARTSGSGAPFIGTLADYLGMKSGDNIYFFKDRTIFGIGKLIDLGGVDCRFITNPHDKDLIVESLNPSMHPFVCVFEPDPFFFRVGVDMDEVLMFCPEKIKSLRFFSKRTFIKLDDFESDAIRNIIARKNEKSMSSFDDLTHYSFSDELHKQMEIKILSGRNDYKLSVFDYIKFNRNRVASEYYIEGAIMDLLRMHSSDYIGKWDFIGRQYPASPPKPSEYVESMDLFGYRYVKGFPGAISKYIVIELKVGTVNRDHIQQTMKYVDWISREYTKGDYSMIEAYTIGYDKEENLEKNTQDIIERNYIIEGRPVQNRKWQELKVLSYNQLLEELKKKEADG